MPTVLQHMDGGAHLAAHDQDGPVRQHHAVGERACVVHRAQGLHRRRRAVVPRQRHDVGVRRRVAVLQGYASMRSQSVEVGMSSDSQALRCP